MIIHGVDAAGNALPVPMSCLSAIGEDPRGLVPISEPKLMTIATYDGSGQLVHPCAAHLPQKFRGYEFWLTGTPYPNADYHYENPCIWASHDGENFVVPAGMTNPIAGPPATTAYVDPHLEFYYDETTPANSYLALYWQWNTDSTIFRSTLHETGGWSDPVACTINGVAGALGTSPSIIRPNYDSAYWIGIWPGHQPYRRDSADGIDWDAGQVLDFGSVGRIWHSWFGRCADGYEGLLMMGQKNRPYRDADLYYCFSPNSWDFKVFPAPVVGRRSGWLSVYRSCLVNIGDRKRVYFSVQNSDLTWRLWYQDFKVAFSKHNMYEGRTVIPLFRNAAIADTEAHIAFAGNYSYGDYQNIMDWNRYRNKSLMYTSSLNQDLTLSFLTSFRGDVAYPGAAVDPVFKYNGTSAAANTNLTIKAADIYTPVMITAADAPILGQILPAKVRIQVKATVAPTAGALSMYLAMWN